MAMNEGHELTSALTRLRAAEAEIERLRVTCGGPCRYWEGRWRDEVAENERLLAALQEIADGRWNSNVLTPCDVHKFARRALEGK